MPIPVASEQQDSVIKNTGLMTAGTMLSRISGLLRTWAMAFALGNTVLTSAYQVANNLPNVLYDLVAGGFLATAFLPVLLLQKARYGWRGQNRYTSNILNITLILLGALSLISCIFADQVVSTQTFTVGDSAEVHQQTVIFFRIFAFQILFYGLGGVITGVLNAGRSFFLTSIAPALNNIVVILSFAVYVPLSTVYPDAAIILIAVGTTAGVAVQFGIQIPALIKSGYRWQPYIDLRDPSIAETIKIALPSLIYIVANLVAYTFRNAFSLVAADNGPSALAYAWMWYQLPYGVVAVSLSSTMFTEMSEAAAQGKMTAFAQHVVRGLSGTAFMIVPLTGLLFVLATPIFHLFHAGAFTLDDVAHISSLFRLWVLSLPMYAIGMYMYKAFASIRRLMSFAIANCALVVVQLALYAVLCDPNVLGLYGIPAADMVYYVARAAISLVLLKHYVPEVRYSPFWTTTIRVIGASIIGSGIAFIGLMFTDSFGVGGSGATGIGYALFQLCFNGGIGIVITFALTRLFRVREFEALSRLLSRVKNRRS